ncbi:Translation initiation factor eIF-2B subunit delta [Balamuthia mandrillaris]
MTSYEDQLELFGQQIDNEQQRQSKAKPIKKANSPKGERIKASPKVRVVGFPVSPTSSSVPISIPSSSRSPSDGTPVSPPSPSAVILSPTSPLSNSLEDLKQYKSRIPGWSSPTTHYAKDKGTAFLASSTQGLEIKKEPLNPASAPQRTSGFASKPETRSETSGEGNHRLSSAPTAAAAPATAAGTSVSPSTTPDTPASKASKKNNAGGSGADGQKGNSSGNAPPQKKQLTRAERRAIQEQQRAAKAAKKAGGGGGGGGGGSGGGSGGAATKAAPAPHSDSQSTISTPAVPSSGGGTQANEKKPKGPRQYDIQPKGALTPEEHSNQVALFSHLPQYRKASSQTLQLTDFSNTVIHPSIIQLGLKYANHTILGSNARCIGMLTAFKDVIRDYTTPPEASLHRTLEPFLKPQIQFLTDCRPHSISMGNAINFVKKEIPKTQGMTEEEAKDYLIDIIDRFIEERIVIADQAIASYGVSKITDGDVILTFASSHSVELILKEAHQEGKKFRVIIADSRPMKEGKELLRRLMQCGIHCTYVLINAVSYAMKEVTKVFFGAFTLLANGGVISRAGTALVAMIAHEYHVPVIVCCETYKFCERVQLDSICFNELGDPEALLCNHVAGIAKQGRNRTFKHIISSGNELEAAATSSGGGVVTPAEAVAVAAALESSGAAGGDASELLAAAGIGGDAMTGATAGGVSGEGEDVLHNWKSNPHLKLLNLLYDVTPATFLTMVCTEVGMIPPTSVPVVIREYHAEY